jgi:hypothetical protein
LEYGKRLRAAVALESRLRSEAVKPIVRIVLAGAAYGLGTVLAGILSPLLHLPAIHLKLPTAASPSQALLLALAATPLLTVPLVWLESGLAGTGWRRTLTLAALMFVALGLNTVIELMIFSTMVEVGGPLASLQTLPPCVLAAAVIGSGKPHATAPRAPGFSAPGWTARLAVAWLSFPVVYLLFGMCVAPVVVPYYKAGLAGFRIPDLEVIAEVQLIRSALFLAASLPVALLWKRSRLEFTGAMGLALSAAVGLFYMAQASYLPTTLRIAHSLEIVADSFVYAAVLAVLFVRPGVTARQAEP